MSNLININSGHIIAKNTLINLAGQGLPLLAALFCIPSILSGLGTDRFGILTLAWMIIGYFSLFDLGLGRALTQIIAIKLGDGDTIELPGLVWTTLVVMIIMGVVAAIIAFAVSPFLIEKVFKMPSQLHAESLHAFYILSASIPIVILSSAFIGILSAFQRFDIINIVRIPLALTNFIVPLLVIPFSNSLVPITILLALSRLASCIAMYFLCLHVMPLLRMRRKIFMLREIRPLFSFGGWMTITNIIGPIMVYLDRFLIGTVISVTAVAYYATPYEMITKLWIIPNALVATLFPTFAANANGEPSNTVQILSKSIAATLIIIFPVVLTIVTFSHEGLEFWLGNKFALNSAQVLQWLAAGVFINCMAQVFFALIQGRGRPDITAKFHLLELIFYIPFLWWVLRDFGIVGAAAIWTLRIAIDGILMLLAAQWLTPFVGKLSLKISSCVIVLFIVLVICALPESLTIRLILFCFSFFIFLTISFLYLRRNNMLGIIPRNL
jgi:O-antigen/teichoic acid export membrane protein